DYDAREDAVDRDPPRVSPHVARRDVAPPAVVEAEEHEDDQLHRNHEPDRLHEQRVVVGRDLRVEAKPERQVPRRGDQGRVGEQLPDAMPVDRVHVPTSTGTADRTASTTRSWTSH